MNKKILKAVMGHSRQKETSEKWISWKYIWLQSAKKFVCIFDTYTKIRIF